MQAKKLIIYGFFLLMGVILGFLIFKIFLSNKSTVVETICPFENLNPLRCDPESNIKSKEYIELRNELVDYINDQESKKRATKVSVFFRDLVTGSTMSIDGQEEFAPASLLKVPLLITYYKQAENDPSFLNKRLKVEGDLDTLDQNIKPKKTVELNSVYTIEELINLMIIQSDNAAWLVLLTYLKNTYSDKEFAQTLSDLGIIDPNISHDEQSITTQSYASIFRILFNASYLNLEMSNKALDLLSKSEFKDGLVAGVPAGVNISHKFGERRLEDSQQLHDCGIIYFKKNPYLLCVMTRGEDMNDLKLVISEISRKVYEEIERRY